MKELMKYWGLSENNKTQLIGDCGKCRRVYSIIVDGEFKKLTVKDTEQSKFTVMHTVIQLYLRGMVMS